MLLFLADFIGSLTLLPLWCFPTSQIFVVCASEIRKQRYVYGTRLDSIAKVTGIVKFDLHAEPERGKTCIEVGGNVQGLFDLGPGRFGSEAVFVPKVPGATSEEDDGYLIFFVHDEKTGYYILLSLLKKFGQTIFNYHITA